MGNLRNAKRVEVFTSELFNFEVKRGQIKEKVTFAEAVLRLKPSDFTPMSFPKHIKPEIEQQCCRCFWYTDKGTPTRPGWELDRDASHGYCMECIEIMYGSEMKENLKRKVGV